MAPSGISVMSETMEPKDCFKETEIADTHLIVRWGYPSPAAVLDVDSYEKHIFDLSHFETTKYLL